jgi:hypothetical protein
MDMGVRVKDRSKNKKWIEILMKITKYKIIYLLFLSISNVINLCILK